VNDTGMGKPKVLGDVVYHKSHMGWHEI